MLIFPSLLKGNFARHRVGFLADSLLPSVLLARVISYESVAVHLRIPVCDHLLFCLAAVKILFVSLSWTILVECVYMCISLS